MSAQSRRALAWSVVAAALLALWPTDAQAGHGAHRTPHGGGHHQRLQRHGKSSPALQGAGKTGAGAPARATTARPAPLHPPLINSK